MGVRGVGRIEFRSSGVEVVMGNIRTRLAAPFRSSFPLLAVRCLALLAAVTGAVVLYAVHEMELLREESSQVTEHVDRRLYSLQSRVRFDAERQRLLLGIRDAILETRPELGPAKSYELATLVIESTEKYPGVDPLLLVAVGIVESGYDVKAISHAGARGLYQIYPPTGRLLAGMMGWKFEESILHDPAKNTEMAACYLSLLGTAYNDVEMILAEYNGGPLNAGYFRAKVEKLAGETRDYVPRVIAVYERLAREMGYSAPAGPRKPRRESPAVASVAFSRARAAGKLADE
jgi:soluble lytic murein transglycosylase-like protein